ncbi:MAG: HxsD-like protein [archaeon]|nr:MAG: HxsD-like protein [archaeon]
MNNIKIIRPFKKIQIKLNPVFYSRSAIEETLEDFKDICSGKIKKSQSNFIISLKAKEKIDLEKLGYEFLNHAFAKKKEMVT